MASDPTARPSSPALVRAVGRLSLTAIALNGMIGAGIFALPATVAQGLGPASLFAYLAAGTATLLITLCFAEAGSLFESSGGPYVYARAAFGPFIGFEVGWMLALSRVAAVAAISNTFSSYLGYFWPAAAAGMGRALAITVVVGAIAGINCLGIRPGVWSINILTVGKLLPLIVFCVAGLFFIDPHRITWTTLPPPGALQRASLLLVFAFGGFEFASVPSEEVIRTRRVLPGVLIGSVGLVVGLYFLIQAVAMGTLPSLATDATPLASAASAFMGPAGGLLLTIGAVFSTMGTNNASTLVGSRMLYALARGRQLPAAMARIDPRFRTPVVSIVLFSAVSWIFAVSGTFVQLAALSVLGRLLYYATTCLAVPILRRKLPSTEGRFTLRGGPLIPVLALGTCGWLLTGTSLSQALAALAALVLGGALYALCARG